MTDRIHSCKESPTGRHVVEGRCCRHCQRTVDYLRDMGWNVPAHDPDSLDGGTELAVVQATTRLLRNILRTP